MTPVSFVIQPIKILAYGFATGGAAAATAGLVFTIAAIGRYIFAKEEDHIDDLNEGVQHAMSALAVGGVIARIATAIISAQACGYGIALTAAVAAVGIPIWAIYESFSKSDDDTQPIAKRISSIDLKTAAVGSLSSFAVAALANHLFGLGLFF